jgi:secreted trypsin-like serine protease
MAETVSTLSDDPYVAAGQLWQQQISFERKIINGVATPIADNPWQVAILRSDIPNPVYAQFCAGSYLSPTKIITAAHCVAGRQRTSIEILASTARLDFGGLTSPVDDIAIHPQYNPQNLDNDVAIISVKVNQYAKPIAIASSADEINAVTSRENIDIAGWGNIYNFTSKSVDLMKTSVPLVPASICTQDDSNGKTVTVNMLCAGSDNGTYDACSGDSGGPAVIHINNKPFLIGVISAGTKGCGQPKHYGLYARVATDTTTKWIKGETETPSPKPNQGDKK